jgi:hypothetical protein
MARILFLAVTLLSSLFLPVTAAKAQTLDQYGGYADLPAPGGATGYFRMEKIGNRWVFVSPQGNTFWMRSVYHANESFLDADVIPNKYGGDVNLWATQRNRRLLSWGFNALGEYTSERGLPVGTWGSTTGNSVPVPFVLLLNTCLDAFANPTRIGLSEPMKDVLAGVPLSTYNGYRAPLGDFYAPMFATAIQGEIAYYSKAITGGFANKPWIVGITPDDADKMFGFKSGSGSISLPYPHPGFFVATTKFLYTAAENPQGVAWQDPKLYSKYAWIAFLKAKYGSSVGALNTAWNTGGFYTSFDDAGGYGVGTGVIDEDGRHTTWVGTMTGNYDNPNASPGFKADLDAFLYQFAKQYAQVTVTNIRAVDNNHLIFGPAALNNFGNKARDEVLRGLADGGIDVFQWNYDPRTGDMTGNNRSYDVVGKPAFIWYTVTANADSEWAGYTPWYGDPDFPTQEARGQHYSSDISNFLNARGSNGDYYVIGIDWWELIDTKSMAEKANMGLISHRDNAYDGKEAVIPVSTDPWGYATGGEVANYGDFLSAVTLTNSQIRSVLSGSAPSTSLAASITSPGNGSTVQGNVTVSATSSGNVARLDLLLDGALTGVFSQGTVSYAWNTASVSNGTHTWTAKAYDALGNTALSSPAGVTVANGTTTSTSVSSSANPSSYGGVVKFAATVTPSTATGTVTFMDGTTILGTSSLTSGTAMLTTSMLAAGSHSITAAYSGSANFSASTSPTLTQTVNLGLTVSITAPQNGAQVPGKSTVTIAATTSVTAGVTIGFYVNGSLKCSDSAPPYSCPWQVPAAQHRTYTLQAIASDGQGNTASSVVTVTSAGR